MKKIISVLIIIILASCQGESTQKETSSFPFKIPSDSAQVTTYYFIRHAEKDRSDKTNADPFLTEKGIKRANHWAQYFKPLKINKILTSNYTRTIQTAIPTASINQLNIDDYKIVKDSLFTQKFWSNTYGKVNLVVGHSNTTPAFVNEIIGEQKYKQLEDSINYKLFKVSIDKKLNIKDTLIDVRLD